jgi:hypothetical protein
MDWVEKLGLLTIHDMNTNSFSYFPIGEVFLMVTRREHALSKKAQILRAARAVVMDGGFAQLQMNAVAGLPTSQSGPSVATTRPARSIGPLSLVSCLRVKWRSCPASPTARARRRRRYAMRCGRLRHALCADAVLRMASSSNRLIRRSKVRASSTGGRSRGSSRGSSVKVSPPANSAI